MRTLCGSGLVRKNSMWVNKWMVGLWDNHKIMGCHDNDTCDVLISTSCNDVTLHENPL